MVLEFFMISMELPGSMLIYFPLVIDQDLQLELTEMQEIAVFQFQ